MLDLKKFTSEAMSLTQTLSYMQYSMDMLMHNLIGRDDFKVEATSKRTSIETTMTSPLGGEYYEYLIKTEVQIYHHHQDILNTMDNWRNANVCDVVIHIRSASSNHYMWMVGASGIVSSKNLLEWLSYFNNICRLEDRPVCKAITSILTQLVTLEKLGIKLHFKIDESKLPEDLRTPRMALYQLHPTAPYETLDISVFAGDYTVISDMVEMFGTGKLHRLTDIHIKTAIAS